MSYHLAQINVALLQAPLDDPQLADFVAGLDPINALAESSPGFVWRLKDDDNNATSLRVFDDPAIIVNMSVWESVEALHAFTYSSAHVAFLRRRREWFQKMATPVLALWWVQAGHTPTVQEAKARLNFLQRHGPTVSAFTLTKRFASAELAAD